MSSQAIKTLGLFKNPSIFEKGIGAVLPEAYKKFYKEWKWTEPTAVHHIPEESKWKRDEVTGEVHPIQNVPIPVLYPDEHNQQLWGGEGVVQGFQLHDEHKRRVPHFWVPTLKRSVVYSEILNKHISVVLTDRTINLINAHYGFDHYLLKTPACDLKSLLPLRLKRKILQALQNNCPAYDQNSEKQKKILDRYKQYLSGYTQEEIEWYGYTFLAACKKYQSILDSQKEVVPMKHLFRSELIEKLKAAKIKEASDEKLELSGSTWLQKMNPFGKKHET